MSAATRETARTAEVAHHYLRLLARERGIVSLAIAAAIAVLGTLNPTTFGGMALPVGLAFFFPLFQWRDGGRAVLDEAMPLDFAAHRRIRAACGTAWAALVLAVCMGGFTALLAVTMRGLGGFPAWYPVLLFGWGLALYCFGTATWLRAERPGRVLILVYFSANALAEWLLPQRWANVVTGLARPAELAARPAWAWAAPCVAALALGCAAIWMAASPGLRLPRLRPGLARRAAAGEPAGARAVTMAPGVRRPVSIARVLWSELAMVGHDAVWALALATLVGATSLRVHLDLSSEAASRLPLAGRTEGLQVLAVIAFFWPLLVWMDEHGPGRAWAEAVPVETAWRRALRLLAGAAWLEAMVLVVEACMIAGAWRAGTIASLAQVPALLWAGFPAVVLIMYLLGSIPLLLSVSHPVRRTVVWYFAFSLLILLPAVATRNWRLSPATVLLLTTLTPRPHWGEALLLWLPVVAVVAVWVLRAGVARDRGIGPPDNPLAVPAVA